ncbi:MAG TPA: anhydro-N-acetylmuramic acid kinase [Chitinophagales bacterium]|nr:anhydro-N-acetylmuramic acid kinase [Chitinophagales bacterium]
MTKYEVIGIMSGSSLDGLDICYVEFEEILKQWSFDIKAVKCYAYDEDFQKQLREIGNGSAFQLAEMHTHFSRIMADYVLQFFEEFPASKNASLIVSHGQTIFHQPEKSFTTQIGCGATLAAFTNKTVVCDLRTYDVALGGQGAPLVPFGEQHLFHDCTSFLNIGGICNISIHHPNQVEAYDVCPGNTLLNLLAQKVGKIYDDNGDIARSGKIHQDLIHELSKLSYYQKALPKSLGTEHIMKDWWEVIQNKNLSTADAMATVVEHIAIELGKVLKNSAVMVTGGGALNAYLIERIAAHTNSEIILPSRQMIEFKEALIIGFVGLNRYLGRNNFYSSVTGAHRDNMGGAIYG